MSKDKLQALKQSQIGCGLPAAQHQAIADSINWIEYKSGETIFQQDEAGDSLLLVAEGRVKLTSSRGLEGESFIEHVDVGEHFGELALLTGQPRSVTATAVMDTRVLQLTGAKFQSLLVQVPGLAANVSRTLGFRLRRETTGKKIRSVSRVIGIVNPSNDLNSVRMSERLVVGLADGLLNASSNGNNIQIISDNVAPNAATRRFNVLEIPRNMAIAAKSEWVRQQLSEQNSYDGHTIVYLSGANPSELRKILVQCEQVLWLSTPENESSNKTQLRTLLSVESRLAAKAHWGWLLPEGFKPENIPPSPAGLGLPDFKIVLGDSKHISRLERMSISRLVRFIRKTRLGLALGGGAARGLAHLGVLKAFEEEGIYFDLIAGTSAGALVGVPYAYGISPDECTEAFRNDLTPGGIFRYLPKGNEWYLLYQFRMGKWDKLLRKHIGNAKLEQLLTPVSTISVDLITGQQVVRDRGDATHGILESINLPNISKPIIRDGMALVDGGVINNVPADVLPERGADLVLGVDIANQMSHRFGKNTPMTPLDRMRAPGLFRTMIRAAEVQGHQVTALRTRSVDQMITVDASQFNFADFSSAREMSEVGAEAAVKAMSEFKRMISQQKEADSAALERFVCPTCVDCH